VLSNKGGCAQFLKIATGGVFVLAFFSVLFFWTDVAYPQTNCSTIDQQLASLEKRKIPGVYTTKIISENGVPKVLYFIGYYRSIFVGTMSVFDSKGCLSAFTKVPNAMAVFELLSEAEQSALFIKRRSH
jgi:hypothetical protein